MPTENRNGSRTICFRIDAEEYEQFRQLCLEQGTGSLSEMARAGLKLILSQPSRAHTESLATRVAELESRVRSLYLELRKVHGTSIATPAPEKSEAKAKA